MAIKQYSLKTDGAKQLSPAFRVREFRCRDGTDTVLIDEGLVVLLQCIREHFGKPVTITSGYRTAPQPQRKGGRLQIQPAPAGPRRGHSGAGYRPAGCGRLRREPDARLGRRGPLPGQGRPGKGLGACRHPPEQEPVDTVR